MHVHRMLQVYSCAVLKDPGSGLNRGYGFIKYNSKEVAAAAMEKLNNTEMKDHPGHQARIYRRPVTETPPDPL